MTAEETDQAKLVDRVLSAFRWVAALRIMGQMINWLATIFVIRFLVPEDYGIMSLAEVFRTFLVLFSTMGLGEGLMKVEKLAPSLVKKTLGLLVIINGLLFLLQFFAAPYIAAFYGNDTSGDGTWVGVDDFEMHSAGDLGVLTMVQPGPSAPVALSRASMISSRSVSNSAPGSTIPSGSRPATLR